MSMLLMVKVMSMKVGNPLRKLVLLKLADNANDNGNCWPSYKYISDQCEISKSAVIKHIKHLEKSGLLRIEHRKGVKGNSSNMYHLQLEPILSDDIGGVSSDDIGISHGDTGGISSDDTRTSHSLESVIEPEASPLNSDKKSKFNPEHYWQDNLNIQAWQKYCRYRKTDIKKPLKTERGCKTQANLLSQHPPDIQQQMVDQSINNEWIKIVELKHENQQNISGKTNNAATRYHQMLKKDWSRVMEGGGDPNIPF